MSNARRSATSRTPPLERLDPLRLRLGQASQQPSHAGNVLMPNQVQVVGTVVNRDHGGGDVGEQKAPVEQNAPRPAVPALEGMDALESDVELGLALEGVPATANVEL